jgi:hypothetical protein
MVAFLPKPKKHVVNPDALQLDPALLGATLAAPWRRAAAMVVDLILIGLLSLLANPVLGLLTGVTVAVLGSRKVSTAHFWQVFRWVLIALGASISVLSGFLLIGRPIVKTSAFNLGAVAPEPTVEQIYLPAAPSSGEYRRAVGQYEKQVETLRSENESLRESARGNSLLNVAADSSRTLGLTFGWAGVYFTLFTSWLAGRTPGKLLLGTRVVRLDGRPLTAMDAFTRNGGYAAGLATGSIGFLRLLWDPNRQAIQDKIAGTVVVIYTRRPPEAAAEPPSPAATDNSSAEEPKAVLPAE